MGRRDVNLFIHVPLYFLSLLYGFGVWVRLILYKTGIFGIKILPCKVISVGNITVGGTGKTPMTIYIAELLRGMGKRVVILSKGYGRRGRGGVVSDGVDTLLDPETAGDEPYLIAERLKGVPVLVGEDRYSAGMDAVKRFTPDVVILDDGFQHIGLKRDMDILLVEEGVGFGNGYLLPRGILREPLEGVKRADVIMVKGGQGITNYELRITNLNPRAPLFSFKYQPVGLKELTTGRDVGLDTLKGREVFALAGIANPLSFIETLEGLGAEVVGRFFYPDHHRYNPSDIDAIVNEIQGSTVEPPNSPLTTHHLPFIVTTAKDGVKLKRFTVHSSQFTNIIYVLEMEVRVNEDFNDFLNQRLKTSKSVNQMQQVEVDTRVRALYTCI